MRTNTSIGRLAWTGLAVLVVASLGATGRAEPENPNMRYRVVFQVTNSQPEAGEGALRNIENLLAALGSERTRVEVVVHSGGIGMGRTDNAALAEKVERLARGGSVAFLACENTMRRKSISREDLLPGFGGVDSGIVQVARRQAQGWQYLKRD